MASSYYASPRLYLESATDIESKITRIEALILATLTAMESAIGNEDVNEYMLNDGQTVIKVGRRSAAQMTESLKNLEAMKHYYVNQYQGRTTRLVDHESTRNLSRC